MILALIQSSQLVVDQVEPDVLYHLLGIPIHDDLASEGCERAKHGETGSDSYQLSKSLLILSFVLILESLTDCYDEEANKRRN